MVLKDRVMRTLDRITGQGTKFQRPFESTKVNP
jgi:hypothetical protein